MDASSDQQARPNDEDLQHVVLGLRVAFDETLARLHDRLGRLSRDRRTAGKEDAASQILSMVDVCKELRDLSGRTLEKAVATHQERRPQSV